MNYYNTDNTIGKALGYIFVALYAVLFVGLYVWGTISVEGEDQQQGMLVDFGTVEDSGSGVEDTQIADDYVVPEPQNVPKTEAVQTQEMEPTPEMEEGNLIADADVKESEQTDSEPEQPEEELKPREVNRRALFPGNTPESPSASQGITDTLSGNQGYIGGTVADNYEGTGGTDGFEPDWDLEGRRPRVAFPRPKYADNEQGIVVVEIWVNSAGDVTGATFKAKGSTVSPKSPLIAEAIKAAKGVKFDQSEQDLQVGTITYTFRLRTGKK